MGHLKEMMKLADDGVKVDFPDGWVHLRKSNTEPIIRIYAEAANEERANQLATTMIEEVKHLAGLH